MIKDSSAEKILETIQSFPTEDPIQLYGFNVNQMHTYSYSKSRNIMNHTRSCDEIVNEKEKLIFEGMDIEDHILTQRIETDINLTFKKYTTAMSQRVLKGHEKYTNLLEYSKESISSVFDL